MVKVLVCLLTVVVFMLYAVLVFFVIRSIRSEHCPASSIVVAPKRAQPKKVPRTRVVVPAPPTVKVVTPRPTAPPVVLNDSPDCNVCLMGIGDLACDQKCDKVASDSSSCSQMVDNSVCSDPVSVRGEK